MPIFNPGSGFTGTPEISNWAAAQSAISAMREAAGGASLLIWPEAGQMGCFIDPLNGDGVVYEKLADIAAVSRASKALHPNWDFVSGSIVGPLVEFANNVPTMGPGGLLVSGQVENLVTNPRFEGAALPAVPTGFSVGTANGTLSIIARGTQNGWPYIDVRIHGDTLTARPWIGTNSVSVGATDEYLTTSWGIQHRSGPSAIPALRNWYSNLNSEGTVAADHRHRRFVRTTQAPAGASTVSTAIWFNTGIYDNTVYRLFLPTMNKTARPVQPVIPNAGSTGATVKQQDIITLPDNGWYRHAAGTLVVEFIQPPRRPDNPNGNNGIGLIRLENETAGEHRGLQFLDSTGQLQGFARQTGAGSVSNVGTPLAAGGRGLAALTWSGSTMQAALNAVTNATFGSSQVVPTATKLRLGQGALGNASPLIQAQAPIMQVRYFPRTMTAAELVAITTPYWS